MHTIGTLEQSDLAQSGEEILMIIQIAGFAQRNQTRHQIELLEFRCLLGAVQPVPIQPCGRIVLHVGIVIAVLRIAEFVSGEQHRRAQRQEQHAEHVRHGPFALLNDDGVVAGALITEIDRMIVVRTVAVVFAVALIMLVAVARKIGHGKTVMAGHVIHGCGRATSGIGGE